MFLLQPFNVSYALEHRVARTRGHDDGLLSTSAGVAAPELIEAPEVAEAAAVEAKELRSCLKSP